MQPETSQARYRNWFFVLLIIAGWLLATSTVFSNIESIRTSAGVGSDTGTALDVLAWLFGGFCMCALAAGCYVIINSLVGRLGLVVMSFAALLMLWLLSENDVLLDGLQVVLAGSYLIAIPLIVAFGAGLGILSTANRSTRMSVILLALLFSGCVLALWFVYRPALVYFMKLYGNNPAIMIAHILTSLGLSSRLLPSLER